MDKLELIEAIRDRMQDKNAKAVYAALAVKHGENDRPDYRTILRAKRGIGTPRNRTVEMLADYLGIDRG